MWRCSRSVACVARARQDPQARRAGCFHAHADQVEGADLSYARLESAGLALASIEGAKLIGTKCEHADFEHAHLEDAVLREANLEGANLSGAYLERADLTGTFFDAATKVTGTTWIEAPISSAGPQLADVHWGAVNLTSIDWEGIR